MVRLGGISSSSAPFNFLKAITPTWAFPTVVTNSIMLQVNAKVG